MLELNLEKATRNYFEKTNTRDLSFNGMFINPKRMGNGNMKLKDILVFDLPAVKTCLNCGTCAKTCYARKAQLQYTDVRIFRDTNLFMFGKDKELLKSLIVSQITKSKNTVVRLHSSGDFFSQSYIEFWSKIIKMFPTKKFYTYTKVENILDFTEILTNTNFNLISSFVGDKLNYGSVEYCNDLQAEFGTFICPVTAGHHDIKCGQGCTHCVSSDNVCFIQH